MRMLPFLLEMFWRASKPIIKSRKKTLYVFYAITAIMVALYFMQTEKSTAANFYWIAAGLGFATGFWAIFVTMGAEQFGTNLRATAATTIPNMVRGSLPLMLLLFNGLQNYFTYISSGLFNRYNRDDYNASLPQ